MTTDETGTPVDALLRLASAARLHRASDGRLHAWVPIGDRSETVPLDSAEFRRWLLNAYCTESRQPPGIGTIQRVIALLEARAWFDDATPSVSIRVGRDPGGDDSAFFLDLADSQGRAAWVCGEGWCVVDRPGIHFWRPAGQLSLPVPGTGGSIDLLRPYVNVSDADFRLLVAWLTIALRPVGPYPILVLYGEQGSAKTTLAKILRLLIDPQACPVLTLPNTIRDLTVTAVNGWLLIYDNISAISTTLSDALCGLVTGGGYASRSPFTKRDRTVLQAQRPIILNGIDEFVRRADAIDRSIVLNLPPIPPAKRRAEDEFWKAFHADYPRILGGALDAAAGGLRELPSVQIAELPRMADFAKWGEAVGRALGWPADSFTSAYCSNRDSANSASLEDSLVAKALIDLGPRLAELSGSPEAVLRELTHYVEYRDHNIARVRGHSRPNKRRTANSPRWPKDTRQFSKELRRILPLMRQRGVTAEFDRGSRGSVITFAYSEPLGEFDDIATLFGSPS